MNILSEKSPGEPHLQGAAFGQSAARRSPRGPRKDSDFYKSRESTRSYIRKRTFDTDLFLTELRDKERLVWVLNGSKNEKERYRTEKKINLH